MRVECNVTFRCNAVCWGCNKAVGLAKFSDTDMTVSQMKKAIGQFLDQNIRVTRFTFCGGEPLLNKNLQELIYEVARLPSLKKGRVLSNGLNSTQHLRDKIIMPDRRFKWIINPLDNPDDPLSGKNDPTKGKWRHLPFWISPKDIGIHAKFKYCRVRKHCGIGLDSTGFSMCGKAVMFGKLFGIDPTLKEGDITKHINTPIEDICEHCQYGVRNRKILYKIADKFEANEYDNVDEEGISETFQEAFKGHKQQPLIELGQF